MVQLRRERASHTLQATALVHEACLKLLGDIDVDWASRSHFCAIAARAMLGRRGVPGTIYFGLRRDAGELEAHAWLRTGRYVVTGAAGMSAFTVVGTFAFGENDAS